MGSVTQYHYNPMAEFAGVTNSQGRQWRYEFDACGRIHTERHYDGRQERYQYDVAGCVVQVGRFTYHYDECGRAIQKVERKEGFRPQATRFTCDEHDRLTRIELPSGERWRYRYDAFGRRVAKACEQGAQASHQVHYLYDGVQVFQQTLTTGNGEALQSTECVYESGSFRPVAQVDTNHTLAIEKLHYVVTDRAGTPRELCAEDGDIVWRGEQSLWHRHTQTLQSNVKGLFEDAANDPVHCDLRYQGQLEDKESGLYYNLNRYYDADSGQYLSSDPIGMLGGLRPQAYVHNPMEWVDPLGLNRFPKWMVTRQGYERHHIIPYSLREHPCFTRTNLNVNGATNMIYLPIVEAVHPTKMVHHKFMLNGAHHSKYNSFMREQLNQLEEIARAESWSRERATKELLSLQNDTRKILNNRNIKAGC